MTKGFRLHNRVVGSISNSSCCEPIMNRLLSPPEAKLQESFQETLDSWHAEEETSSVFLRRAADTAHNCFAPVHYESGYAYPLIVWLHGHQGNECELSRVVPLISLRNHVAVSPRGTMADSNTRGTYSWQQSAEGIDQATQRVHDCIEIAKERFHVNPDRVFIAGYQCGGTMALRIGLEHPDLFAGAISLGGPMPSGFRPLRRINEARKLPLLLSASQDGTNYPLADVMGDLRLLHFAGCSLSLRLYPAGNDLTTNMLSDVDSWIFEQF